jgi:hypothetical protein
MAFLGIQYKGIIGSGAALGFGGIKLSSSSFTGLLDLHPNASAAYSVRKLKADATNALRVRRSSDNAEQDIGFVGTDLDTESLLTFVGAGNGYVTKRYDQSGNNQDEVQETATLQPIIVSSGTLLTKNGIAAITLLTGQNMRLIAPVAITATRQDAFHVIDASNSIQGRWATIGSNGNSVRVGLISFLSSTSTQISIAYGTPTFYKNGIQFTGTTRDDVYDAFNAYTLQSHINTSTSAFTNGLSLGFVTTNNDFNLEGTIQEDVYYNFDITASQADIESNINAYYSIYWDGSQTGLLDDYPSASAAYSVRALNSAYTGPLMRVRRSNDNAEQDIYANYDGNLDTTSLLSFVKANDGYVVTWYDQSTNGLNTTNSTASQQRQIVVSGVLITDNGKPASKDIATSTQYSTSTPVYAVDSPDVWTFSVQNAEDTATNTSYIFGANTYNGFLIATYSNRESVDVRAVRTGGSSAGEMGVSGALVGQQILTTYADRVNVASFLNGVELSGTRADSDTDFLSVTFNTILGMQNSTARSFDGYFQEFIIYEVDQTANQSAIESNINTYYSIY